MKTTHKPAAKGPAESESKSEPAVEANSKAEKPRRMTVDEKLVYIAEKADALQKEGERLGSLAYRLKRRAKAARRRRDRLFARVKALEARLPKLMKGQLTTRCVGGWVFTNHAFLVKSGAIGIDRVEWYLRPVEIAREKEQLAAMRAEIEAKYGNPPPVAESEGRS